jgi:hypothetical protein
LPASGRGFAFAKQGNKMHRLKPKGFIEPKGSRRHNHAWAKGKNYAVFYFAGKRIYFLFLCCDYFTGKGKKP